MVKEIEIRRQRCGTMAVHRRLLKEVPYYKENRLKIEKFTQYFIRQDAMTRLRYGIVRIPVVVHVVYNTASQNISDAQIQSQIDVLNEDFRRLNADASSTPSVFQSVAADMRIEFHLAVRNPDCNTTTGITRTSTTTTFFTTDDAMKSGATGGRDPWPSDKYLNIWVCNLSAGLLGYSQFPGGPASTDGVVIHYTAFGTTGTAVAPFDRGRTATHEIGHWLNLLHIWGDDAGGCGGSDQVDDTPNQADENYGCPSFPHVSCSNGPNGDMFMNYMDYTDDTCMNIYTAGQLARMDAALHGPRSSILGSGGLIPPPAVATGDLWSQNTPQDVGDEPDNISGHMCLTDDIWVRNQNDGMVNQEHENPEYRPPGFGPNYVYVRIRNRGCNTADSATVKLYWAKASTALGWPAPWDGSVTSPALMGGLIGTQATGSQSGGGFVILEFPWYPPNPADYSSFGGGKSHFCLLSRVETSSTSPYGMTYPEGSSLYTNVKYNNNIVWKNITVVDEITEAGRIASVLIGGPPKKGYVVKLIFTTPKPKGGKGIFDWGRVKIDLGSKLFEKWKDGGSVGAGIRVIDKHVIAVLEPDAWIGNLKLTQEELHTIGILFEPHKKEAKRTNIFSFDIMQYFSDEKKDYIMGGMRFVVKIWADPKYVKGKIPTLVFDGVTWIPAFSITPRHWPLNV